MKRKFDHSPKAVSLSNGAPSEAELTGRKYWRSLDELAETPGFKEHLEREFPEGASTLDGVDRRKFFKLMAASFALGGVGLAAGCRRPEAYILPYGKSVEEIVLGLPLYFATAMPLRKSAIPLLAETHQGRPTKLEGNPTYAPHGSASSLLAQASVLDLYDPDRATTHTIGGTAATTADIQDKLAAIGKAFASVDGAGLAFLADESSSPTRAALVAKLKAKFPKALWAEYEPIVDEPPVAAAKAAFGRSVKPVYRFAKAKRILSLDADFFHAEAGSIYYAREFAKGRRVASKNDEMNRLYVAESHLTLTGAMADHRLRVATSHMLAVAAALACELSEEVRTILTPYTQGVQLNEKWIAECAKDLRDDKHKGQSLIVAGSHLPVEVHTIVYGLNWLLGNVGKTVDFVEVETSTAASIGDLASSIKAGSVKTLVVLGGNPAYNAPADLDWAALQSSVTEVIRYGYYVDETSLVKTAATTHIGAAHYLESWGDARTADGTIVPVQPMILPLFNGLTEIEVLARIVGETTTDPYAQVRQTITTIAGGDAEKSFRKFLHDGLLEGSSYPVVSVQFSRDSARGVFKSAPKLVELSKSSLEVRFVVDHKMDDGRFANNGWLQECPDPITKIAWDNAILISPKLARELGVYPKGSLLQVARIEEGEIDAVGRELARMAEVTLDGRTIRGPLHIQPGLADFTIVLPLGYGRKISGRVGKDQGFSAYPLRTAKAATVAVGAKLEVLSGERYQLSNTQNHWSMEGRDLIREANFEGAGGYRENPAYVKEASLESHSPPILGHEGTRRSGESEEDFQKRIHSGAVAGILPRGNSLYETPAFTGEHQWGMSIDLNTCIGCNACVVACQAENNIPIVGKDQVLRGREMHWIRLDRYYSDGNADGAAFGGDGNRQLPENPQISLQPVACQQCELAPCETVCPVNATVHDDEGLNAMAYNRCIGTRYCANNCPYKVRRFNYFDWNKRSLDSLYLGPLGPSGMPELVKMVKNPDVTVRMRGVMEKCTYCVQRIQQAKIAQKAKAGASDRVKIPDGTIKVACQQVCPAEAIVFGDISDPQSAVSQAKSREQDYALLGYLNIRPRTTYLGKLRNPNPSMPDYVAIPFSRTEYNKKNHPGGHEPGVSHGEGESSPSEPAATTQEHAALKTRLTTGGLS